MASERKSATLRSNDLDGMVRQVQSSRAASPSRSSSRPRRRISTRPVPAAGTEPENRQSEAPPPHLPLSDNHGIHSTARKIPEQDYGSRLLADRTFSDLWRETLTLGTPGGRVVKAEIRKSLAGSTGAGEIAAGGAILFAGLHRAPLRAVGALDLLLTEHSIGSRP